MRINYHFFSLVINILFISAAAHSQTINFNETWQEFLTNQKISNISGLPKPDKLQDPPAYAKYLLMNTNSRLCQSQVEGAESLMAEIVEMNSEVYTPIPGFVEKKEELESKIEAYYSMDEIWKRFLQTKEVSREELEAVTGAKMSCEKRTLAKYSYMTAYNLFCQGNISGAKNIFENRTVKLIEQTDLRLEDVEGLAPEAAKMKRLFGDMPKLESDWRTYVQSGVSPGFDIELPLFSCNPTPNMKALILKGAVDVCNAAPAALAKIKQLQTESGVTPDGELQQKLTEMEAAVEQNNANLAVLNEAWAAFLPNNEVRQPIEYGYEYCDVESVIRAYIMDGFAYGCAMAADMLQKIEVLLQSGDTQLEQITLIKISELVALNERYQANGIKIEALWNKFVRQGDNLSEDFETDLYCDNIHQVKAWTIKGLSVSCEEGQRYLDQIEDFDRTFEFNFTEEVECRVQKLRIKIWDCRYTTLQKLARVEASPESYEERLRELMEEYGMGARPEPCSTNK